MKFSLISATSIFALAAAAVPAHAYFVIPAPRETESYGLVDDSNATLTLPDPSLIAVAALRATAVGRQDAGFTGPVDRSAAVGITFPRVPLGAAPGTSPDDDLATKFAGAWHWNALQKALAIGVARIAPLIGSIGNGSSPDEKPGRTVFAAQSSPAGFNNGSISGGQRRAAAASGLGPSSTSTATITVTGQANLRQRAGSGFSVAVPIDAQSQPPASKLAPADPLPPTPSYHYAPQLSPTVRGNLVVPSFSDAVSASGDTTLVYKPMGATNNQPGASPGRPNLLPAKEDAAIYARRIVDSLPIDGRVNATRADGTQAFLPASVSIDPAADAARYVMSVLDAASARPSGQTVEAFQIGASNGALTPGGSEASVTEPLREKIPAGVGPLDNSLALP